MVGPPGVAVSTPLTAVGNSGEGVSAGAIGVSVTLGIPTAVGESAGISVNGVLVSVGNTGTCVGVLDGIKVSVGRTTAVSVGTAVTVSVGMAVGTKVAVLVGVLVQVGV
jgi:hypothetical protein